MARGDFKSALEYFEDYLKKDLADEEKVNTETLILKIKSKLNG